MVQYVHGRGAGRKPRIRSPIRLVGLGFRVVAPSPRCGNALQCSRLICVTRGDQCSFGSDHKSSRLLELGLRVLRVLWVTGVKRLWHTRATG